MSDVRQLSLLMIVFAVPVFLMLMRRETLLVKWICLTVAVDIFAPKLVVNLPAARVAGLLLLPSTLLGLGATLRSRAGKALVARYLYLVLLGIVFGFVFPWPSAGFLRSATQVAPGRTVVYLIRSAADVGLVLFIAQHLVKTRRPDRLVEYGVVSTSIAALGGVFQFLTRIDPYDWVTGLRLIDVEDRMRGFNNEPRGLGLVAASGFVLSLLLYSHRRSLKWLAVAMLHGLGVFLTVSTSSLFAGGVGLFALFMTRKRVVGLLVAVGCALAVLLLLLPASRVTAGWLETWDYNVQLRLTSDKPRSTPGSRLERFALRMDIFDASALLFLVPKPTYLVVGAGPGLVGLPATEYVPKASIFDWAWQQGAGLNTVPHMGLLRELSDAGALGLVLLFVFFLSGRRALLELGKAERGSDGPWSIGGNAFFVATAIYLIQASSVSAVWPIFLGIGLAAARILQECGPAAKLSGWRASLGSGIR
jgi:membrane-bound metal-dependent hydrolase YbcI (DUF457 family)